MSHQSVIGRLAGRAVHERPGGQPRGDVVRGRDVGPGSSGFAYSSGARRVALCVTVSEDRRVGRDHERKALMGRKYFGTDGVRGTVGEAPITPDFVMRLGYAAGKVLAGKSGGSGRPTVLIGKDTRVSGYMLESALEAGLSSAGVDVLLVGPMPTPGVAYLTRALRLSAGIVISASHNPYHDNGIKFFSADGNRLPDATEERRLKQTLDQPLGCTCIRIAGQGSAYRGCRGSVHRILQELLPGLASICTGLRIVVDCAHGAGYHTAPHVFRELGAEVK